MADSLERGLRVVACYPRSMSAWLSNLITVPCCSIYAHDILSFPDMVKVIEDLDYPYRGIVDTGATAEKLPDCDLTVIDNDLDRVNDSLSRLLGRDTSEIAQRLSENMEALKPRATVYHMDHMDEWIQPFYEDHTGLPFDRTRYRMLKNLNMQSQYAIELARGEANA